MGQYSIDTANNSSIESSFVIIQCNVWLLPVEGSVIIIFAHIGRRSDSIYKYMNDYNYSLDHNYILLSCWDFVLYIAVLQRFYCYCFHVYYEWSINGTWLQKSYYLLFSFPTFSYHFIPLFHVCTTFFSSILPYFGLNFLPHHFLFNPVVPCLSPPFLPFLLNFVFTFPCPFVSTLQILYLVSFFTSYLPFLPPLPSQCSLPTSSFPTIIPTFLLFIVMTFSFRTFFSSLIYFPCLLCSFPPPTNLPFFTSKIFHSLSSFHTSLIL